jgi:hypothetical protein
MSIWLCSIGIYLLLDRLRRQIEINQSMGVIYSVLRLVAMDDFATFKKIMVKRNVELQLEALQTFRQAAGQNKRKDIECADDIDDEQLWRLLDDEESVMSLSFVHADACIDRRC